MVEGSVIERWRVDSVGGSDVMGWRSNDAVFGDETYGTILGPVGDRN